MGITGELVRNVFSRSRSVGTHESSGRSGVVDKKRWSSVRSYLCGDESNSVLAEQDSASARSSEATVTQPITEGLISDERKVQSKETKEEVPEEKPNSVSKLLQKDDAASVIQAAFRSFLARREGDEPKKEPSEATKSPSRESISTSIEVQTGKSVEVFEMQPESMVAQVQHKSRSQVMRQKEDWDDSTVSSNMARMRIQNRLEATTRRERALAYAFAQQLRICSKKKQARSNSTESNMSWSWLERWMATRVPENSSVEDHVQMEPICSTQTQTSMVKRKLFNAGGEERESCGSNEVSVQVDEFLGTEPEGKSGFRPTKNRHKASRSVSRRKTVPSHHCPKEFTKVARKEGPRDAEKEKPCRPKEAEASSSGSKCKDAASCQLLIT